jgi:hypothetical protein
LFYLLTKLKKSYKFTNVAKRATVMLVTVKNWDTCILSTYRLDTDTDGLVRIFVRACSELVAVTVWVYIYHMYTINCRLQCAWKWTWLEL